MTDRTFNVFVIDSALIHSKLSPIQDKVNYLDYVSAAPFLVKSLYQKSFIDPEGTHCFIYFQKEDAFLVLYKNGEYVYSKSLRYSLKEMNEKFCELLGERVDEEDFYRLLSTDGLRASNGKYQQYLMQLFGEVFLYINDVIVFSKRSYEIEYIDKVYIGSEVGSLFGIEEYCKSYLGLEAFEFDFNIAINSKKWYIDQIHILMMLTAQVYLEEQNDSLNFSPFKRPPPLKQRASGQFLAIVAASLIAGLAYPMYQLACDSFLSVKVIKDTSDYNAIIPKTSKIRNELSLLKSEKDKVDALLKEESTKLAFRKKLLSEIYSKKASYPMKAKLLLEIFSLSNKNGCKVENVSFNHNSFNVSIQNKDDKKITQLIKDLTDLNKFSVNTNKISQDDITKLYKSTISIGLNNE